jgi:hypothetical protein
MAITVSNISTSSTVNVSVNEWGEGGSTSFYQLPPNGIPENWDRTDPKGFIMSIQAGGMPNPVPYYVLVGDSITINYNGKGQFVVKATNNDFTTTLAICQRG